MCHQFTIYQTFLENPLEENCMEPRNEEDLQPKPNVQILVLDNFDNLIGRDDPDNDLASVKIFFRELHHFIKECGFNYRVIFVSNNNFDLSEIVPKLELSYPPKEYMAQFVSKVIHTELQDQRYSAKIDQLFKLDEITGNSAEDEELRQHRSAMKQSNISNLISLIIDSLESHIKDYTLMEAVAKKFLEYSLNGNVVQFMGKERTNILSNRCNYLSKLLVCRTMAGFRSVSDLIRQIEEVFDISKSSDVNFRKPEHVHQRVTKAEFELAQKQELHKFDIPLIPAAILIACYIANNTSDKKDVKMFGQAGRFVSNKGRRPINRPDDQINQTAKAAPKERIEFMAQFLMDLMLKNKKDILNTRELTLRHQSTQFVTSYHLLEDFKLIKRKAPVSIDQFSNIKFECKCDAAKVQQLATNYGITIEEFVKLS
jgi:Origin recognition complex (ORC) subunit 5 C-terminus